MQLEISGFADRDWRRQVVAAARFAVPRLGLAADPPAVVGRNDSRVCFRCERHRVEIPNSREIYRSHQPVAFAVFHELAHARQYAAGICADYTLAYDFSNCLHYTQPIRNTVMMMIHWKRTRFLQLAAFFDDFDFHHEWIYRVRPGEDIPRHWPRIINRGPVHTNAPETRDETYAALPWEKDANKTAAKLLREYRKSS